MKILCGRLQGRVFDFKANPSVRPTSDRARKAIFDMLRGYIEDRRVLDLFSGSGALGFEALSAGASEAIFVERDKVQCKKIADNLKKLDLEQYGKVLCADARDAVRKLGSRGEYFDLVFLDPPYDDPCGPQTLEALAESPLLGAGGYALFECRSRRTPEKKIGTLVCEKIKNYGDTEVCFFKKTES